MTRAAPGPVILALDSGTSVVKAVAFAADGTTIGSASRANLFSTDADGAVEQDMARTWTDARDVLAELVGRLAGREIAALAVTAQGDGTWLIDADGEPVAPAWLWLDSRAAVPAETFRASAAARIAFAHTGSGYNACQQSAHLLWLAEHRPEVLARAATAFHCKDWLYFCLTGTRVTDPSEACFTFGSWRERAYSDEVIEAVGVSRWRHLLPPVLEGTRDSHKLSAEAAAVTGLPEGLPVVLGYLDVACAALGAGLYGTGAEAGVSILGSTGMHLRLVPRAEEVRPNPAMTGYCMTFPVPGHTMQAQTNMAATLNMDWVADMAWEAAELAGAQRGRDRLQMLRALDDAVADARPGAVLYHPFISLAGERGPFTDSFARASLLGIDQTVRFAELARGVYEGLGFAARDCYLGTGKIPDIVYITGGAARSAPMRAIVAAAVNRPVRIAAQAEAGAAGAAMMAAVRIGMFPDMASCAEAWVAPLLGAREEPDPALAQLYDTLYPIYREAYAALPGVWRHLAASRETRHGN
ncbi:MAG TPA: FGGY-family carbohydrate kinase [Acetobacteraceae bacterium]|nr:FGGY-family carbohydrate kinase [Acetobacteraceae bacterium]